MTSTETAPAEKPASVSACSFCMKSPGAVEKMVAGPGVFICNECAALCVELIKSNPATPPKVRDWNELLSDEDLLATLPKVASVSRQVEGQLAKAVAAARERGITWTRIGAALNMTRQSAWERFSGEE
jgi:ATP-dependent Clp protease ATP-binding subunit ClpX